MEKEKQSTYEIIRKYEGGLYSLSKTWYLLMEATERERGFLLLFRKILKDVNKNDPAEIAENLIWLQDLMMDKPSKTL